MKLCVINPVF